jgi:hypothetical protein
VQGGKKGWTVRRQDLLVAVGLAVVVVASGWIVFAAVAVLGVVAALVQVWAWVSPRYRGAEMSPSEFRLIWWSGAVLGGVLVALVTYDTTGVTPTGDDTTARGTTSMSTASTTVTVTPVDPPGTAVGILGVRPRLPGSDWSDPAARVLFVTEDCLPAWGESFTVVWDTETAESFCGCVYDVQARSGLSFETVNEARVSDQPDPAVVEAVERAQAEAFFDCAPDDA